jgi:Asp-tRNA(Asn)/Glu-tRNA(Gln) amidotransferase B subunit
MGFFVGQVIKLSGGKADPKQVQPVLRERLARES